MVTLAFIEVGSFILRFVGTCAVFYPFFLCRTIGAGDIKLMGVVTGFLGVWDGVLVIGLGMVLAAAAASYRMIKQGTVWFRLERAARFAVETGMKGRLTEYPGSFAAGAVSVCGVLSVFTDPVKRRERISYRTA